jgi:plastocyanin
MLTSTVLVAATLTAAVVTAGGESEEGGAQDGAARSAGAAPMSRALELAAEPTGRPLYDKDRAAVKAGKVEIRLANASSVGHNVTITRAPGLWPPPRRSRAAARP